MLANLSNLNTAGLQAIRSDQLFLRESSKHAPRVLLLYGILRARSFSRLMREEAAQVLNIFGAKTCTFDPSGLPLPMMPKFHTKRSKSFDNWLSGQKVWFGVLQNAMEQ